MTDYKYGTYATVVDTPAGFTASAGTTVVYVGTAPIHLLNGYADKNVINEPIKLTSMWQAQSALGYVGDFGDYTLCEAMKAHFDNIQGNIGPIIAINVLDPEMHKAEMPTDNTITFTNGYAEIDDYHAIVDSILIETYVNGVDFTANYDSKKSKIIVKSIGDTVIEGPQQVSYYAIDPLKIVQSDIIGGYDTTAGTATGIGAVQKIYPTFNLVTNLLLVPKWSEEYEVYSAMCQAISHSNGQWDGFVYADLPIGSINNTIAEAVGWKAENAYTASQSKVFWPHVIGSDGKEYHISTLAAVETLRLDQSHGDVPMETVGNKRIPVKSLCTETLVASSRLFDRMSANELAKAGISTVLFTNGQCVVWGDHTAAFVHGQEIDPKDIFDVTGRMLMHISNGFQQRWAGKIDKPMTPSLKDTIVAREQEELDSLVAIGALLGNPTIQFVEEENPTENIASGVFKWNLDATPTTPFKAAELRVAYTTAGFSTFFGGEN